MTYHFAESHPIEDASVIVMHVVNDDTFARIERYPHPPLLPFDKLIVVDREAWSFRLSDVERFEVFPETTLKQFWDIFAAGAMIQDALVMGLASQRIIGAASSKLVNTDNLLLCPIHDWDDGKWVRVKVSILVAVACICGEDEALEEAPVLVGCVQSAIWPWFDDHLEPFGQFELLDLLLEEWRLFADFNESIELRAERRVNVRRRMHDRRILTT